MAIYTTVFAATEPELDAAFPAWRRALTNPVKRSGMNPFTKEPITYDSWEPDGDTAEVEPTLALAEYGVVQIEGDYEAYLRARLPPGVQKLPHFPTKGLLSPDVDDILAFLGGNDLPKLRPARFPPQGSRSGEMLDALPPIAVNLLNALAGGDLAMVGAGLSDEGGLFSAHGWSDDDCTFLLGELHSLAREAAATGRRLYLLTEP